MSTTSQNFIGTLTLLFTAAICVWAVASFIEILNYRALFQAQKWLSQILNAQQNDSVTKSPDYLLVEGRYKSRRVVCRLSLAPIGKWPCFYQISIHAYIQPQVVTNNQSVGDGLPTKGAWMENDKRIHYNWTSSTSNTVYFLFQRLKRSDMIMMLNELTTCAEFVEEREQRESL